MVDDPSIALVVAELAQVCAGTSALACAIRHVVWALGWRARRDTSGRIQVSVRYVAEGAGVSTSTAATACRRIADLLCADRDRGAWWTLAPEAIAACHDLAWDLADQMSEPAAGSGSGPGVDLPTGPVDLPPVTRGKARCPCGQHAHGDAHPSLVFDRTTGLGTCLTTGSVIAFDDLLHPRIVRSGWGGDDPVRNQPLRDCTKDTQGGSPAASPGSPTAPARMGSLVSARLVGRRRGPFVLTALNRSIQTGGTDDVARMLRGSDRAFGGPRSQARAEAAAVAIQALGPAEGPIVLPERFWSIDRWGVSWRAVDTRRFGRVQLPDFQQAVNVGSGLSLLDLDGLDEAPTDPDVALAARIRRTVRRASGGRLRVEAIVATSRTGMQVTVAWDRFHRDTAAMYRDPSIRRTLTATADAVLQVLGRGGEVDRSAWASGRYARRPGWRVGKDGRAVRARLWWARS